MKKNKTPTEAAPVASYKHKDKRARIPTQEESVKLPAREKQPVKKRYAYDPSLDPQLNADSGQIVHAFRWKQSTKPVKESGPEVAQGDRRWVF